MLDGVYEFLYLFGMVRVVVISFTDTGAILSQCLLIGRSYLGCWNHFGVQHGIFTQEPKEVPVMTI